MAGDPPIVVPVEWLLVHLDDPHVRIVDATTVTVADGEGGFRNDGRAVYDASHVPGAVHADLVTEFNDPSAFLFLRPSSERFAAAAGAAGVGDGVHVVVYDQGADAEGAPAPGVWASRLWWQFRSEGFDSVSVLDGGFRAWTAAGAPTRHGAEHVAPATFTSRPRPGLFVDRPDVEAALGDPATLLVDSRAAAAYRGDADRPYRSGHIPGAVHVPSAAQIDPVTGALAPAAEVRERFRAAGALEPGVRAVVYCGGGVSATWNALALVAAGGPEPAVYDGSMLEWGADPASPLVVGDAPGAPPS